MFQSYLKQSVFSVSATFSRKPMYQYMCTRLQYYLPSQSSYEFISFRTIWTCHNTLQVNSMYILSNVFQGSLKPPGTVLSPWTTTGPCITYLPDFMKRSQNAPRAKVPSYSIHVLPKILSLDSYFERIRRKRERKIHQGHHQ